MPRPRRQRVAIPRRLTLRGRTWRVVFTRHPGKQRGEPRGLLGFCDEETHTLQINPKSSRVERELTFVHELTHALIPSGIVSGEVEEQIVRALEKGLHSALVSGALVAVPEEPR